MGKKVVSEVLREGNTGSLSTNPADRNWEFTLNNPTDKDELWIQNLEVKFICVSLEYGEKCGTPHYQGKVIFKRMYRKTQLISYYGE